MYGINLHKPVMRIAQAMMLTAFLLACMPSAAQTKVKIDNYYYTLLDSTASLAASEDTGAYATGRVTIPSSVTYSGKSYKITEIEPFAFSFNTGITSVVIPLTMRVIGEGAFQGCTKLFSVSFRMTKLEEIGNSAFEGCSILGSISLPATVERIGDWAFAGTALSSIGIPASVEYLGKNAFLGCTKMTVASIKTTLKKIPDGLFSRCTSLTNVAMTEENRNKIESIGKAAFFSCSKMSSYTFGDTVSSIEACGFMSCTSLSSVSIPSTVTYIGHDAFAACTAMASATLPEKIDTVGDRLFKDAHSLKTITMSDSVKYLGEQAFAYCTSLSSAHLSSQITEIPFKAFAYCSKLTDVNIPESVTIIGDSAFTSTQAFDSLSVSRNIASLGNYAFANISTLKYVYLPSTISSLGNHVFANDKIGAIYAEWPKGPTIMSGFFASCDTLYVPNSALVYYRFRTGWKEASAFRAYDATAVGIDSPVSRKDDDNTYYDLDGLKVVSPVKGRIYIHGGKKVIAR